MAQLKYEVFSDFVKSITQRKDKNPIVICIDPGLKGAILIYWHNKRTFWTQELPMKSHIEMLSGEKIKKSIIDLHSLIEFISEKITLTATKEVFFVLEKPFKTSIGSLKTYTTSVLEIGKLLAIFECFFIESRKHFLFVAPSFWIKEFNKMTLGINYHSDIKKNLMLILVEEFKFDRDLFFTRQGRFKDGISDASAMFIWFLKCADVSSLQRIL
ncbi:MAG: hypothetical protein OQJ78_05800 [Ignavibacteriaceae bacterium]|nr:hypothetical protein [Ignavibacteriaceae bacterium]